MLSLESTITRSNRLGSSLLTGVPLLSLDELVERVDAVTLDDLSELAGLFSVDRISAAGVGPDEESFVAALTPVSPDLTVAA